MANRYEKPSHEEIKRINRLQRALFDKLYFKFEPPLPKGVPEKLQKIVSLGDVSKGDTILDVGAGTGILVPYFRKCDPARIIACDLSSAMLQQLKKNDPHVETILADVRDLQIPDSSIDAVFINACYPNIVDKGGAFENIGRMMKPGGRMIISHPLGKAFIHSLKEDIPFPLDEFPEKAQAANLLKPYGFKIKAYVDEPELYVLVAIQGGRSI
jgi:ubiquinone/menaquinone biosynthesis C-methylase UbiE